MAQTAAQQTSSAGADVEGPVSDRTLSGRRAILVIGAGDATGGAIARRFAREGYIACVTRRTADKLQPLVEQIRADGGEAHAFGSDARNPPTEVPESRRRHAAERHLELAPFGCADCVRVVAVTCERRSKSVALTPSNTARRGTMASFVVA